MDSFKLDFKETGLFSKLLLDYVDNNPKVAPFYSNKPSIEGFSNAIESKSFSKGYRHTLVEVLKEQYQSIESSQTVTENINSLQQDKTYTVTTGHQLNIFTGPLFYIYKLVATINLAKKLKEAYPVYHFVPVYWMGSEDHDYEEINHLYVDGKKYTWPTEQRGATGRFTTDGLQEVLNQLPGRKEIFENALKRHSHLADVVRDYVNALFGEQGLVILDADDARFKKEFLPVIEDELFNEGTHLLVDQQSKALDEAGYKQQLQPRELNLFYLEDSLRARLVKEEDGFSVVDTTVHFSNNDIRELLLNNPERFSPNVILRPVYQETILPNLAYVGGPSELAYWFQLGQVFNHFNLALPILLPRSFAMYIGKSVSRKIKKLELSYHDLFLRKDLLVNKYVKSNANGTLNLDEAKDQLELLFKAIQNKAALVDSTLGAMVESEHLKGAKSIDKVEQKMLKAEKRKRADELKMIEDIFESLYPGGTPHERKENLLSINDPNFIQLLLDLLDPLLLKYEMIIAD